MNAKQIQATNKDTAEVHTGTIKQIADLTGINLKTLTRNLTKKDTFETDLWEIKKDTSEPQKPKKDTPKLKKDTKKDIPSDSKRTPDKYLDAQKLHMKPSEESTREKVIIPSGLCVICERTTYHTQTIDGELVFICYAQCQDIDHHTERIRTDPKDNAIIQLLIKEGKLKGKVVLATEIDPI
jgi:hypothetical protein